MAGRQHYSTRGLVDGRSLGAWRDYMSAVYYELDILPTERPEISGELTQAHLDAIGVSVFKADAQKVVRGKAAARKDASENFVFLFPLRGAFGVEQKGRGGLARPGAVALLNSSEGYEVTVRDRSENVTLKIPCDELRSRLSGLDAICGSVDAINPILVPAVAQLGVQLIKMGDVTGNDTLQRSLVDLVCVMLECQPPAAGFRERRELADIMFERILTHLADSFCDPTLTPVTVAQAMRISPRYLHRLFQMHGSTFGDTLMDIRLHKAHDLLLQAHKSEQRIPMSEIAYRCGFVSQSHFCTRFRAQFGVSPREV